MKVGVDQSPVSVSRCKYVGTRLCRFLTRVYPVVSLNLVFMFEWHTPHAVALDKAMSLGPNY